jgi:phosphoglycolate phosphatase
MPKPAAALMWDLDGTLVDSRVDLAAAANAMRSRYGLDALPVPKITAMIGDGLELLVTRALEGRVEGGECELGEAIGRYREHYNDHCVDETKVYDGLNDVLHTLHAGGMPMVVVTNKPEGFARRIVQELGLAPYFRGVVGGDSCTTKKPEPAMLQRGRELAGVAEADVTKCVMIGDNWTDITGGRNAGMPTCAVQWGFGDPVKLYAAEPHFIAEVPADLPALFLGE